MDLTRYRPSLHAHDFTPGGNSRVVMIRKKEQRTFASTKIGQEPKFETLTKETVQTYRGNKIERKITSQTRDSQDISNELLKQLTLITLPGENEKKKKSTDCVASLSNQVTTYERKRVVTPSKKKEISFAEVDQFTLECLDAHNEKRAIHNSPPLRLSKKLCKYSEEWARHLAAKGEMLHRSESEYGENLFLVWSSSGNAKVSGAEPVENWYAEIKDHVFYKEPTTLKTGHFTQVVWVESEELGVGIATSKTGQVFVVCNYNPPGNFIGSFAENVPPIGGFTSPPKTMASEVKNDESFQQDMIKIHNEYRARHGSPPVKINKEMNKLAQEWAVHLVKENKLEHRPNFDYGENLFSMWGTDIATAKEACKNWYSEVKNFSYGVEPRALNSGHFTQMIWRDSKEIGCGRAKGSKGMVAIVVIYKPKGNVFGQFTTNVLRPN